LVGPKGFFEKKPGQLFKEGHLFPLKNFRGFKKQTQGFGQGKLFGAKGHTNLGPGVAQNYLFGVILTPEN